MTGFWRRDKNQLSHDPVASVTSMRRATQLLSVGCLQRHDYNAAMFAFAIESDGRRR